MNYYLSVIPFLAAVQTGVIGDGVIKITVQGPAEGAEDYCTNFTDCAAKHPDLMSKWETFFNVREKLLLHASLLIPNTKDPNVNVCVSSENRSVGKGYRSVNNKQI